MSLINSFATGIYPVKRQVGSGSYVEGIWVEPNTTTLSIEGSLQPFSPRESALLSEGDRDKEFFNFYTDAETFPGREQNLMKGDIVTCYGRDFEVRSVERWQGSLDFSYFKAKLVGVTKSEGSS